jgi:hypothetical protein
MALNMDAAVRVKASVDGLGEINSLNKALGNTERQAKETGGALGRIKGVAGGLAGALGAIIPAAGIAAIAAFGKRAIDAADNLNDLSKRTGVSVESLSRFQGAADDSGTSIDEVAKAMGRFSKGLVAASSGADEYASKVKTSSDDALEAIRRGEREQTDLIKDQGRERLSALQDETDSRMRELNKRYRGEQTLLNDSYDDQADREREVADQSLREVQRQVNSRYDLIRDSIKNDQSLSDQEKSQRLDSLRNQEEDELNMIQKRFASAQKLRDRQLRDARRIDEDALEDRRRAEESIIKKNSESQSKVIEAATAQQLAAVQANYKKAAESIENGTKGVGNALAKLGISAVDSSNKMRPVDELMLDIADKFSKMPDGAQKTALAMELFGRAGANLIPMLNGGRDAIGQYASTISTDMAQAADMFNDSLNAIARAVAGPFNQAVTALLPFITQLAQGIAGLVQWFSGLPAPLQNILLVLGALTAAFIALAPAISAIISIGGALAGVFAGGAIFAGVVPAITAIGGALSGLLPILAAVFTGPVGWIALLVAAGVAIYAFRDQIGAVFQGIGYVLQAAAQGFKSVFIDPITRNLSAMAQGIGQLFQTLGGFLSKPFQAAANAIRGIVNGVIGGVQNAINGAIGGINQLIAAANRALAVLQLPQIPFFPGVSLPRFADGGVVNGPTMALVGEGGEPEYIVPQSKAAGFAANWMAGRRGASAIPRFAEGGVVMPTSANVSIQTGPVTQMNGTNYVTTQDMSRAVQAGVNQTLAMLRNDMGTRRAVGLA